MAVWLSLRDDGWDLGKKASDIISVYLNSDGSNDPAVVAASLDALTLSIEAPSGDETEELQSFFVKFWDVVIEIAEQLHSDGPSQDRLVDLVRELSNLPPRATEASTPSIWRDLPQLTETIEESWWEPSEGEDLHLYSKWVKFNAFVSRLYAARLVPGYKWGVRTMREALENDTVSRDNLDNLDELNKRTNLDKISVCRISAAVEWIEHSRNGLLQRMLEGNATGKDRELLESELFSGEEVLSLRRWRHWRDTFSNLGNSYIEFSVSHAANEAAHRMSAAENPNEKPNVGWEGFVHGEWVQVAPW